MAESLERIEENRRNLVANISHDIRSPITSISGFAAGILDGTIPADKQTLYLNKVLSESKRLGKITNDLLELSNMQQGQMSAKKQLFELNEIIRRAIVSFEQQIIAKNLQIELHVFDENIYVYSDPALLERILVNLLDNAVKFTPANGHILIHTTDQAGKILVELFNDGVAIDQEEIKRIWDRFHKGDASRGEHRSGFGLGLAIVREIISLLGEKIWAESGSDFVKMTFTLDKVQVFQ
jgi:signal transduction histidine kinase